jgi:hypothetical protein
MGRYQSGRKNNELYEPNRKENRTKFAAQIRLRDCRGSGADWLLAGTYSELDSTQGIAQREGRSATNC